MAVLHGRGRRDKPIRESRPKRSQNVSVKASERHSYVAGVESRGQIVGDAKIDARMDAESVGLDGKRTTEVPRGEVCPREALEEEQRSRVPTSLKDGTLTQVGPEVQARRELHKSGTPDRRTEEPFRGQRRRNAGTSWLARSKSEPKVDERRLVELMREPQKSETSPRAASPC